MNTPNAFDILMQPKKVHSDPTRIIIDRIPNIHGGQYIIYYNQIKQEYNIEYHDPNNDSSSSDEDEEFPPVPDETSELFCLRCGRCLHSRYQCQELLGIDGRQLGINQLYESDDTS